MVFMTAIPLLPTRIMLLKSWPLRKMMEVTDDVQKVGSEGVVDICKNESYSGYWQQGPEQHVIEDD